MSLNMFLVSNKENIKDYPWDYHELFIMWGNPDQSLDNYKKNENLLDVHARVNIEGEAASLLDKLCQFSSPDESDDGKEDEYERRVQRVLEKIAMDFYILGQEHAAKGKFKVKKERKKVKASA